jgi:hypothetical protein
MSGFISTRRVSGVDVIEYNPTVKMLLFVYARCHPKMQAMDDEAVLLQLGFPRDQLSRWREKHNPHFDTWYEEWMENFTSGASSVRFALEAVGLKKAFGGDFQFWKPFAIKHQVIKPDEQNINLIPSNLGDYDNLSESEVDAMRNSLLQTVRGVEDQGGTQLPGEADSGGEASDPFGVIEM